MKSKIVELRTNTHSSRGELLIPAQPKEIAILLAHGAGGNRNQPFMKFFQHGVASNGYPCLNFNFAYSEAGKKAPDPPPVLKAIYERAIEAAPGDRLVIGGKSMGGRIASYIANSDRIRGLLFLGYPLHPPGKTSQLRDEHLYKIDKPMLFISGSKDPFARLDLLEKTIQRIGSHASVYLIKEGGHSFEVARRSGKDQNQIYEDALKEVLNWLEKLS